jgi:hypothetical protein
LPSRISEAGFAKLQKVAKPTLVGEFGGHPPEGWIVAENDDGVCLHNGLWAGTMSGGSGAPMYWWWGYVEKTNLWKHFSALGSFIKGVDWNGEEFRPAKLSPSNPNLWATGLRGKDVSLLWVQNKKNTFYNHREKVAVEKISNSKLTLAVPEGKYTIEQWNTYEGKCVETVALAAQNGQLTIHLPELNTDVAYKVLAIK